jgi:hypothetical protein
MAYTISKTGGNPQKNTANFPYKAQSSNLGQNFQEKISPFTLMEQEPPSPITVFLLVLITFMLIPRTLVKG